MVSACGLPTWFEPTELSAHESSFGAEEAGNAVAGSVSVGQ